MKKQFKLVLATLAVTALTIGVGFALPTYSRTQPVQADSSDKYDGDCQPSDTAGRCADKCPADTSEGTYYVQGYDKDTGAVVCGFSFYHACPYADAVSADDPLCAKLQAQQTPAATTTAPVATTPTQPVTQCGGK